MAHHRHHRTCRKHKRRSKNIVNKTINKTVFVAKNTSKKYMPKIKFGLENVGKNVVKTGQHSIPFLQQMTRNFFGMFSKKSKTRKYRQ
jgi:hypothetical protein